MKTLISIAIIAVVLCLAHAKTAQECQNAYKQCQTHLRKVFDPNTRPTNEESCSGKSKYEQCMDGPTTEGCADKDSNRIEVQLIGVTCGSSSVSGSVQLLLASLFTIFAGVFLCK